MNASGQQLRIVLAAEGVPCDRLRTVAGLAAQPIYAVPIARDNALALWERVRGPAEVIGYWPVISSARDEELLLTENIEASDQDPAAVIAAGLDLDPMQWLQDHTDADVARATAQGYSGGVAGPESAWPDDTAPSDDFYLLSQTAAKYDPGMRLVLVPARASWQVPAHLAFGGWNECPPDEVHVALLHRWHQRYGAELVVMTGSILELRVAQPPRTRSDALALAQEQFTYCPDIVTQGTETVGRLAASLLNGHTWFFWWD
jgi:hypothetical protein